MMRATQGGVAAICVWLGLAGMLPWSVGAAPNGGGAEPAEPVDAAVVEYVAASALGMLPSMADSRAARVIPPESVEARLTFDRQQYNIGDPIFVTFSVTNVGRQKIDFETGGDYRAGRARRFAFTTLDEEGRRAPDPLAIWIRYGMVGGLGNGATLEPGETWSQTLLLQKYAAPRTPGTYTCSATFGYSKDHWKIGEPHFVTPAVNFLVRNRHSTLSYHALLELQERRGYVKTHPSLLWGARGQPEDARLLVQVMRTGRMPGGVPEVEWKLSQRNTGADAAHGLALMPDKAAVYRALNAAILDGALEKDEDLFHIAYVSAADPRDPSPVEAYLDHTDARIRRLALAAALERGSAAALERLPAALRDSDRTIFESPCFSAIRYLLNVTGPEAWRVPGLSDDMAPAYRQALIEGLRHESDPNELLEYFSYLNLLWDELPAVIAVVKEEPSGRKSKLFIEHLRWPMLRPEYPPMPKAARTALDAYARETARNHPALEARVAALHALGLLGDDAAAPFLETFLAAEGNANGDEERTAAALALYLLGRRESRERCIAILARAPNQHAGMMLTDLASQRKLGYIAFLLYDRLPSSTSPPSDYCARYRQYRLTARKRVLELLFPLLHDPGAPRVLEVKKPALVNEGRCRACGDAKDTRLLYNPLMHHLPFCAYCGAALKMATAEEWRLQQQPSRVGARPRAGPRQRPVK